MSRSRPAIILDPSPTPTASRHATAARPPTVRSLRRSSASFEPNDTTNTTTMDAATTMTRRREGRRRRRRPRITRSSDHFETHSSSPGITLPPSPAAAGSRRRIRILDTVTIAFLCACCCTAGAVAAAAAAPVPQPSPGGSGAGRGRGRGRGTGERTPPGSRSRPRRFFERDDHDRDDDDRGTGTTVAGLGREFERVFLPGRGGEDAPSSGGGADPSSTSPPPFPSSQYRGSGRMSSDGNNVYYKRTRRPRTPSNPYGGGSGPSSAGRMGGSNYSRRTRPGGGQQQQSASSSAKKKTLGPLGSAWAWVREGNLPKIQCRVEPNTTLKLRKRFRPLKTVVTLGADFNTQLGVWQFKSSWEDSIIGGRLTLSGRELQLSKTWLLSVGAVEDLVTRLRLRAAVDLGTGKAYARLGFRTERLSPINVVEGFTLVKRLPLDGNRGNVKLEVRANFAFPEPEIEYSTENNRSIMGMGDIEINIDEMNLLLDY